MITVSLITATDDLQALVDEINAATWDTANDVSKYDLDSLNTYLAHQDTVFVAAHETIGSERSFLGMASARVEIKPYDKERWLYVDEVDVCVDHRKKGAGKAMMRKLLELADSADCEELWLGTEVDNDAANALYKSLDPHDVAQVVGYTFEMDD